MAPAGSCAGRRNRKHGIRIRILADPGNMLRMQKTIIVARPWRTRRVPGFMPNGAHAIIAGDGSDDASRGRPIHRAIEDPEGVRELPLRPDAATFCARKGG
ncbi:MAG: hypothetical protein R3F19_32190 [Verrucomicrobiales bacterium]